MHRTIGKRKKLKIVITQFSNNNITRNATALGEQRLVLHRRFCIASIN